MNKKEISILDEILKELVQIDQQFTIQNKLLRVFDDSYKQHCAIYFQQSALYKAQEEYITRLHVEIEEYKKEIHTLTHFNRLIVKN